MDYSAMQTTSANLIAEYGQSITLTRYTSSIDPVAGTNTQTSTTETGKALMLIARYRDKDGGTAEGKLLRFMMAPAFSRPSAGDRITAGTTTYTVVSAEMMAPGGTTLYYDVEVRV